jgi:hypothetical protein
MGTKQLYGPLTNDILVGRAIGRQLPSTDEHQSVSIEFEYPDATQGLNRWLPPFRLAE